MSRYVFILLLTIISLATGQSPAPQEVITNTLAQAEALYFQARFNDSLQLLLPLDVALGQQPGRVQERIAVKLQLALVRVGLNQTAEAKVIFSEVCVLDPNCSLDPQQFSPKVVTLFEEAKAESTAQRCGTICRKVSDKLDAGDLGALVEEVEGAVSSCGCMLAIQADAAELFYRQAVDSYKRNEYEIALSKLSSALRLRPDHEPANQYVQLTQEKMRLDIDRLLLEWRAAVEARQFDVAKAAYQRLQSANIGGIAATALGQAVTEYRKLLTASAEAWTAACARSDALAMQRLSAEAGDLLPERTIGEDILGQMTTCAVKGCIKMPAQLAMTRIKERVSPELPGGALNAAPFSLQVSVRIDQDGNVVVNKVDGVNSLVNTAVQTAVENWKFFPAIVGSERRCVETDIPIVLSR